MHNPFQVKRRALLMISALLATAMSLGSCGSHKPKLSTEDAITEEFVELRMEAEKVVTDSVRRGKYLAATTALEDGLRAFDQTAGGIIQDYQKAFADYNSDKTVLNNIAAKYRAEQSKAIADFVQAHTAMASSVTADEWKPLAKQEAKMIDSIKAAAARSLE